MPMPGANVIPLVEDAVGMTALSDVTNADAQMAIHAMSYLVTTGKLIPPWYSRQRDIELHRVTKQSNHLSGLFYLATTKLANIPVRFIAKDPTIIAHVDEADRFTAQMNVVSEFGAGMRVAMKKFIYDYMLYDNGGFQEIIGPGRPDGPIEGRPLGVRHLDSQRCVRTGNPIYPVRYQGEDNKWYKFHFTRIIMMAQQPSGLQNMNGVGFSAASRCYEVAQVLGDQIQYKLEKMGSRPTSQIIVANNMETAEVVKAFVIAEEMMNQLGMERYRKNVVLAGQDIDVSKIDLNNFEPFDEETGTLMAMYALAYIIGLDIRDIWPISGAKASDQIANMKARGRLPADFTADYKQQADYKLSPTYLEVWFDFQDDDEDMQAANIRDIRSRRVERLTNTKAIDPEGQRRMLLADRDITREEFIRLQYADGKTEDGSPIATCFFSPDPLTRALCTVEGFEEPTVFEENDPELIKPEIQRSLARVLELLAMTRSVAQRRKAQLSYAALEWLQGEYDMIMMLHAREAAAEQRVEGDEAEAEGEEPEEEPEEEEEVAEE
jgi:hypothetical protein